MNITTQGSKNSHLKRFWATDHHNETFLMRLANLFAKSFSRATTVRYLLTGKRAVARLIQCKGKLTQAQVDRLAAQGINLMLERNFLVLRLIRGVQWCRAVNLEINSDRHLDFHQTRKSRIRSYHHFCILHMLLWIDLDHLLEVEVVGRVIIVSPLYIKIRILVYFHYL